MPCRSASASLPVAMSYSSLLRDQRGHRVRRRAVHPDLAVPVERHEPPGRVDQRVDHGQVEAVPLGDLAPVVHRRAAQRVGADPHAGRRGSRRGRRRSAGRRRRCPGSRTAPPRPGPARTAPAARRRGRPGSARWRASAITEVASVSAGPPCGGLYLKPPSDGGLCDGVTTMPSARPGPSCPRLARRIACETAGRRRVAVAVVDQHGHVVGGQHLERGRPRRLGQPVGVAADEQRAVVALLARGSRRSPGWWPGCASR